MTRVQDPFYRQVVDRLNRPLDQDLFEQCACDLLKPEFPGLFPIPGGQDNGMDGAVADGEGEAFPLVCTTAKDIGRNLKKSLTRYKENGGSRRKALCATSQALTARRRQNLENKARKLGFTLIQVVEQQGIANLLYRSPRWHRELQLTGTPSALSAIPLTRRPRLEIKLVGRESDLEWLTNTQGDRLLSGQPGSGKTYLLYQLVQQGTALFLVSDDKTQIANALRQQKPETVIVDDAHIQLERLDRLQWLREELGLEFSIIATTWPGDLDRINNSLRTLPKTQIRQLELLTRREILQVLKLAGVETSEDINRRLIDQAANKPGLAVSLAQLWNRGDWKAILSGEALSNALLTPLEALLGSKPTEVRNILACFGLGGRAGMPLDPIAQDLGLNSLELRRQVTQLAAAGVITEVPDNCLRVEPPILRSVLLKKSFFSGSATDLPYRPLLEAAPDRSSAIEAVVAACVGGSRLSFEELTALVMESNSTAAWRQFTVLGERHARWALTQYPADLEDLAIEALEMVPTEAIDALLAAGKLSRLKGWISDIDAYSHERPSDINERIHRRELLAERVQRNLQCSADRNLALEAFQAALSPQLGGSRTSPARDGLSVVWGTVEARELAAIEKLWQRVAHNFEPLDLSTWLLLNSLLQQFLFPCGGKNAPLAEDLKKVGSTFLQTICTFASDRPGLIAALLRKALGFGIQVDLKRDPDFELLYLGNRKAWNNDLEPAQYKQEVEELASRWLDNLGAEKIHLLLERYEEESRFLGNRYSSGLNFLGTSLAERVEAPLPLFSRLLNSRASRATVTAFLATLVKQGQEGWQEALVAALKSEEFSDFASLEVLFLQKAPTNLLQAAFKHLADNRHLLQQVYFKKIPIPTMRLLLESDDPQLAGTAALQEGSPYHEEGIRSELRVPWRQAILHLSRPEDEDTLSQIFWQDPDLGFEWMMQRIKENDFDRSSIRFGVIGALLRTLTEVQREKLLYEIAGPEISNSQRDLIPALVQHSPRLFEVLHERGTPKWVCGIALEGEPSPEWYPIAQAALDVGFTAEEVVKMSLPRLHDLSVEYFQGSVDGFAALQAHSDTRMQAVGRIGVEMNQAQLQKERDLRRSKDLAGILN